MIVKVYEAVSFIDGHTLENGIRAKSQCLFTFVQAAEQMSCPQCGVSDKNPITKFLAGKYFRTISAVLPLKLGPS